MTPIIARHREIIAHTHCDSHCAALLIVAERLQQIADLLVRRTEQSPAEAPAPAPDRKGATPAKG